MSETLSISERLSRMRGTPAVVADADLEASTPAAPADEQADSPDPAPESRGPSYGDLKGRGTAAPVATPVATPVPARAAMFERMAQFSAKPRPPAAPAHAPGEQGVPLLPWDDDERPAGSQFSLAEWQSARDESGFARTVVCEVHKKEQRGLMVLDGDKLDAIHAVFLDCALLIDDRLQGHPAWGNAQARLEHFSKELHRWGYRVVHAEKAADRWPGLRTSRLRTGEPEAVDQALAAPRQRG